MTINALMAELDRRKIALQVHGARLRVTHASALDDSLRAALRRHKAQIVEEAGLPFLDYVLCVFGGEVVDTAGGQSEWEM